MRLADCRSNATVHLCCFTAQHCSVETHITECIRVRPTGTAAVYLGGCSLQSVHQRRVHAGPVQQLGVLVGPAAAWPSPTGQPYCQHCSSTPPLPCPAAQWVTASATNEQSVIAVCLASEQSGISSFINQRTCVLLGGSFIYKLNSLISTDPAR